METKDLDSYIPGYDAEPKEFKEYEEDYDVDEIVDEMRLREED